MAEQVCILVVEDERDTADMLSAYFETQGYEVLQAAWGKDAIKLTAERTPDLILLDIRLPDIDGYEVCRQLRMQRRTQDTPIIFLTEKRERLNRLQGLELGAVDYITKPFDIQELRLRVRNALRRASFDTLTDPITALPAHELVRDRLTQLLQQHEWALINLAVDGLDDFGDAYGFVARDDVLRAVALMLNNVTQEIGGEDAFVGQTDDAEFIMVMDLAHAREVGERIIAKLKQSVGYFYPHKEIGSRATTSQRPELRFTMGAIGDHNGPFAGLDALMAAMRSARRPV
jgi:PleD family two-component response regulator